jgi:uncharacterized protein (DUF1800 family)
MSLQTAAIATARFGLGPSPGDLERIAPDPRRWLMRQLRQLDDGPAGVHSRDLLTEAAALRGDSKKVNGWSREVLKEQAQLALEFSVTTQKPFQERLVRFWSNVLAVSAQRKEVVALAGSYEREAIRPNILGRFEDLLLATTRHPAMQLYLDNHRSTGPDSRRGRKRGIGLNENLAREVLELHTLGVDGGYGQEDVEALAALLTGWGLEAGTGFSFAADRHQPGDKVLLGKTFSEGEEGCIEALRMLARHPSTARNHCRRLAVHLVDDDPDPKLVDRLVAAWGEGNLSGVVEALLHEPAAWQPLLKVRSPQDLVIATARAMPEESTSLLRASVQSLRQPMWAPASPAGWPDVAVEHTGPDAVLSRVQWCQRVAARATSRDAAAWAQSLLGPLIGRGLDSALTRHDDKTGMALVLASPEFQRR